MGSRPQDRKRRRRAKEERRRRRERERARDRVPSSAGRAPGMPLDAPQWPLLECRVEKSWHKPGSLVTVLVARRGPTGDIAAGVFLVDLGCLGAKNGFMTLLGPGDYAHLPGRMFARGSETCDLAFAARIVRGGIAYARSLGFEPHRDAVTALPFLGPESPEGTADPGDARVSFGGADGKPWFVAGPDDDAAAIVERLQSRLGPEGFHFIAPLGDGLWEEFDADPDDPSESADSVRPS